MLIAIISDIHDNLPNLDRCLAWCQKRRIKTVLFCGDTTNLETAHYLARYPGEIFMVSGNEEFYESEDLSGFPSVHHLGKSGTVSLGGRSIGLVHDPRQIAARLKNSPTPPDYLFYGHTHKPWLEKRGPTVVANPGNISGTWYQATFATLDTATGELALKILAEL
ncbi:MAG: YfcE family phosphodiesterase [Patescibacteria group bacterium]